ncbi:hypothetical protein CEXT_621441 [Caerostris extrusa]|uniref:Uncharacterized protein n=1 Tax=Caerostris extrusa TaxID=172846 RepID=A0AAV4NR79_CAEEX|nr:hypothetical protein CEXT_621441 [Caerostris extrusa]
MEIAHLGVVWPEIWPTKVFRKQSGKFQLKISSKKSSFLFFARSSSGRDLYSKMFFFFLDPVVFGSSASQNVCKQGFFFLLLSLPHMQRARYAGCRRHKRLTKGTDVNQVNF